jgi:hypothetical protein
MCRLIFMYLKKSIIPERVLCPGIDMKEYLFAILICWVVSYFLIVAIVHHRQ